MTGKELRAMREEAGIPGYVVAKRMGRAQSTVNFYERGVLPIPAGVDEEYVAAVHAIVREKAEALGMTVGAAR